MQKLKIQAALRRWMRRLFGQPRRLAPGDDGLCLRCRRPYTRIVRRGAACAIYDRVCAACSQLHPKSCYVPRCLGCGRPDMTRAVTGPVSYDTARLGVFAIAGWCPGCVAGRGAAC